MAIAVAHDLTQTTGFVVADNGGRVIGTVECPMYGTYPDVPDALSVRGGRFSRQRRLVPADTIDRIDATTGVVALRVARDTIRRFLSPNESCAFVRMTAAFATKRARAKPARRLRRRL